VNVAFIGLPKSWEPFVQGICAQETVSWFDRLCIDCIKEETQLEFNNGLKRIHNDKFYLFIQERKGKFKNISSGESISQDGKKKKEMRKVKFFACHKFGYYAGKCPHWKEGGNKMQSEVDAIAKAHIR
jgi:hypothetical protein